METDVYCEDTVKGRNIIEEWLGFKKQPIRFLKNFEISIFFKADGTPAETVDESTDLREMPATHYL